MRDSYTVWVESQSYPINLLVNLKGTKNVLYTIHETCSASSSPGSVQKNYISLLEVNYVQLRDVHRKNETKILIFSLN